MSLIILPPLLYFLVSAVILVQNQIQVRIGYHWLSAFGGSFLAWLLIWFSRTRVPQTVSLARWGPEDLFSTSPTLFLDQISWAYMLVLGTLVLAVLFTDAVRAVEINSKHLAAGLAMTGLGILGVMAENPLTLMIAWAGMDLAEIMMLLPRVTEDQSRERIILVFSLRVVGIFLVLTSALVVHAGGRVLSFQTMDPQVGWLLLLAALLRLGVLPFTHLRPQRSLLQRGLGTILQWVPVANSLMLATRVASVGLPSEWEIYVLILAALVGLYGGYFWVRAESERMGRPYWILGLASLVFASSLHQQWLASLAWGTALLFSGAVLFLTSLWSRLVMIIGLIAMINVSALPFTPAWPGRGVYSGLNPFLLVVFVFIHGGLLWGYLKHSLRKHRSEKDVEPWVWVVYPLGLALLPLTHWALSWSLGMIASAGVQVSSFEEWVAVPALGVAFAFLGISRRNGKVPTRFVSVVDNVLSFRWLYRLLWGSYRTLARFFQAVSQIFGRGGGRFYGPC